MEQLSSKRFISSMIRKIQHEYNRLGLQTPFNQRLLDELLNEGVGKTRFRLRAMIRNDLTGKDQDLVEETLNQVDSYLTPLSEALENYKNNIGMRTYKTYDN